MLIYLVTIQSQDEKYRQRNLNIASNNKQNGVLNGIIIRAFDLMVFNTRDLPNYIRRWQPRCTR